MPSFKIICLLVLEKKIFKGFCYLKPWRPSWSCDLDHLYKLSFPFPMDAPHEFGFDWPSGRASLPDASCQVKFKNHRPSGSEEKIFKGFCYL